jgi:hypothetical protein
MHAHQLVTAVLLVGRSRPFEICNMQFNGDSAVVAATAVASLTEFPAKDSSAETPLTESRGDSSEEAAVLLDAAIQENVATTTKASSTSYLRTIIESILRDYFVEAQDAQGEAAIASTPSSTNGEVR